MKIFEIVEPRVIQVNDRYTLYKSIDRPKFYILSEGELMMPFGKFLVRCINTPSTDKGDLLKKFGWGVLKRYGVPFNDTPSTQPDHKPNYGWDGSYLYTANLDGEGLFHEIAHWVVTTTMHRNKKEFGMGTGFNSAKPTKTIRSRESNETEEDMAVMLEICLIRYVRGDWRLGFREVNFFENKPLGKIRDQIPEHIQSSMIDAPRSSTIYSQFATAFDNLVHHGLVTPAGEPKWSVRITDDT